MPISLVSYLVPKGGASWFLLEDTYLKGGYRVCDTLAARNATHSVSRKAGMLVYVVQTGETFRLAADKVTWVAEPAGSGGSGSSTTVSHIHTQTTTATTWTVAHGKNKTTYVWSLFDAQARAVIPDELRTIDANTIQISFRIPVAGRAVFIFA